MYKIYQIENGDTIENIAGRLGINPELLITLNGLNNNTNLIVGSYIIIPKGESLFNKYIVMKDDNIYKIARNYNINPNELIKLNGLNPNDIIYPGDEILIPKDNTGFYITESGDTINKISSALNIPISELSKQNSTIYLMPDQLIVYKK
ncbi:MAG: LysM peptidoglycan-binding domain-containing protein [Bacilli bacterium]|nr:LysM peptidoglycan-binding domain-containing protein [Bacilli bacterium]